MLSSWFTVSFPSKPPLVGYRYKQTSTSSVNAGVPVIDGQGYITGMNLNYDRLGSGCTANFTVDPTKGDVVAFGFTRTVNPSAGTSTNIHYGSYQSIVASFILGGNLYFQGQMFAIGTLVANKIDIAYVLNFTTKTVKLLVSTVVGGPKTLLAEKPFATVVASNVISLYADADPSSVSNLLVYNNETFAL